MKTLSPEKKMTTAATWYDFLDMDLIATAYSVYSILKHTPEIPLNLTTLVERESPPWSIEEEEWAREMLYEIISEAVHNKLYFDSILMDAQRKRIFKEHDHWYDKDLEDDIRQVHWTNAKRRAEFQQHRGKSWDRLTLAQLPDDYYQVDYEWSKMSKA
jgi:hypothetical protein